MNCINCNSVKIIIESSPPGETRKHRARCTTCGLASVPVPYFFMVKNAWETMEYADFVEIPKEGTKNEMQVL